MGNSIPTSDVPKRAKGGNRLINNDVDYYNLLLVEKGIRPHIYGILQKIGHTLQIVRIN